MSTEETKVILPEISVILATIGTKTFLLEKCIRSLQKQTFNNFEIVLVYSVYPKGLDELFKVCKIFAVKENKSTLGAARNLGVKHARGKLVAFIDDDCEAPENWLEQISLIYKANPKLSCLGGPNLTPIEEYAKNPLRSAEGSFKERGNQRVFIDGSAVGKIGGCNVVYRKLDFEKIGGLNEALRSGEDWELHIRLAEYGYHLRLDPTIFVWHHRQGLKHAFWDNSRMVPFYLSLNTLKYAKKESKFGMFYLTNFVFICLFITLFISLLIFAFLLTFSLLGYFVFTIVRTKTFNRRIVYYPLIIVLTLASLSGFYFGLLKNAGSWFLARFNLRN